MKDVKGGYQIVEIATGNTGMYKALEAAYNAKKPILVKKEGHSAFGNVTKDGNYYVANYIIDDTLYQDTISVLDAITDGSVDIGGADSEIQAIEERLNKATLSSHSVSLATYTSADNVYTVPNDGYIRFLVYATASTGRLTLSFYSDNNTYPSIVERDADAKNFVVSVFARKGTKCYVNSTVEAGKWAVIYHALV